MLLENVCYLPSDLNNRHISNHFLHYIFEGGLQHMAYAIGCNKWWKCSQHEAPMQNKHDRLANKLGVSKFAPVCSKERIKQDVIYHGFKLTETYQFVVKNPCNIENHKSRRENNLFYKSDFEQLRTRSRITLVSFTRKYDKCE